MIPDLTKHVWSLLNEGSFEYGIGTVHSDNPYIFSIEDFLTAEECEYIIEKASMQGLVQSTVLDVGVSSDVRNSYGTGISPYLDDVMKNIFSRIAKVVGMPVDHSEPMQVVNYKQGQYYRPHRDTFPEDGLGSFVERYLDPVNEIVQMSPWGQRVVTAIINLNDDFGGGYTVFPEINKYIVPKRGKLTVFQLTDSDGKELKNALHEAETVAGDNQKWLCNCWFREYPRSIKYET
jgi:prolyl 4-hydroxylase